MVVSLELMPIVQVPLLYEMVGFPGLVGFGIGQVGGVVHVVTALQLPKEIPRRNRSCGGEKCQKRSR